jgi:acetyl-CoA carboxylase carboxyltransferase component
MADDTSATTPATTPAAPEGAAPEAGAPGPPARPAPTLEYKGPTLKEATDDLAARKARARAMAGEDKIARQHSLGKLTVRERIDKLFDADSFTEFALLGHHQSQSPQMQGKYTPADGVVCGVGRIEGRRVCLIAYDFTVMAGSMGMVGELKSSRMRELALRERIPIVWLIDSAGARIQEAAGSMFARTGELFREQVEMSGVVPQVAAMMGPGAAGTAYIPGLADFVPMVKGTSSMALGGPHLVKAAVGEDVTEQEMGGSQVHCKVSGVADLEVANDDECLDAIRRYLSFFPAHNKEQPPVRAPLADPVARRCEDLYDLVPANPRKAYDIRKVIKSIVDDGEFFAMKPDFARSLVTGLARFGGRPAGIVANQPMFLGGAIDVDAADKAARFVWLCDAFNIPLVFLMDCPGFLVGSAVEKQGIIRHGSKMLFAVSEATVPKVTVVLRKGYGAGYYVMNGRAYEPDLIVAWPTAEISVMGPEGAVNIIGRSILEKFPEAERESKRNEMIEAVRSQINAYIAAGWSFIDDLIDPADTRSVVCNALANAEGKTVERPWRKHGVLPV